MNKYISIGIIIFFLGMISATDAVASIQDPDMKINYIDTGPLVNSDNITKLDIIPPYGNIRLQPGENKETTVTVKNNENKSVVVKPNVIAMPYSTYMIDTNWITINPNNVEIPAGGSVKFTINVSVPKDATVGSSAVQIAFTNETISGPYPPQYPQYVHVFQLSIDIWKPPNLQIDIPYINDGLEAGKVYDYEIKVKNTGNYLIGINPKLMNDMFYGPYGIALPILNEQSITITAPQNIPAGTIATIKIHISVPADVIGYYNGYIDLNSDDPAVQEGEGRISLNFNIWKQPTMPFVKVFTIDKLAPITIEVSSFYNNYPYLLTKREEPSFDTNLTGPTGSAKLNTTKTIIKGNVNTGIDKPLWAISNASPYQEMSIQQIFTYKTDGSPGKWTLNILPNNTQSFDYSITIGDDK